ncbi:MAG: response regulator [Treponemataceae bacterium]
MVEIKDWNMGVKLKILLVDDQILFAESLGILLTTYASDLHIVGIVKNGKQACDFVKVDVPDIILMDVRMPIMNGIDASKKILTENPQVKIIMLSSYDEEELVRSALLSGVSGYLLKEISPTELILSIRALNSGIMQISPSIAQKLVQNIFIDQKKDVQGVDLNINFEWLKTLTKREREIFVLLATGHNNDTIASQLGLALQTVRNQVSLIYSKLEVKNRFEIIQLANTLKK